MTIEETLKNLLESNTDPNLLESIFWADLYINGDISIDILKRVREYVDWYYLSEANNHFYKFTIDFLEEFQEELYWDLISRYQVLEEDAIERFEDRLDFKEISASGQTFSTDFIRKYKDHLDWYWISKNQELTNEFKKEFKSYLKG